MVHNEREIRSKHLIHVAHQMMTAARTAPKGKGMDIIEIVMVTGSELRELSDMMFRLGRESGLKFMLRDAENILSAEAVILIGTAQRVHGLNCAYCGYRTCAEKPGAVPCAINTIDVGIAVGSACATAADLRVDTRAMFSAGWAAEQLGFLGDCRNIIGIPVSASSKNPFFDRKPKESK